jgi:hypothetical protein
LHIEQDPVLADEGVTIVAVEIAARASVTVNCATPT